jgi:hypothetical protein
MWPCQQQKKKRFTIDHANNIQPPLVKFEEDSKYGE